MLVTVQSMNDRSFCIIDIETTGGRGKNHKITEIGMVRFDGNQVVDQFSTLINPERNIPYNITALTGITNEMVCNAPKFFEVAKKVVEFLGDDVFVAHNVFFDFNILKSEFSDLGFSLKADKLCTVKMARKFIPGHKSYSLGKVCEDLGINIEGRHRALGDALATVELLKVILQRTTPEVLLDNLSGATKILLPDHLDRDVVENLPDYCGLYYFRDKEGRVIYVGKSIDIQKRVKSHFRPDLKREKDILLKKSICDIDTLFVGHEWVALIIEACEIKKIRPQFNKALNRVNFRYGMKLVEGGDDQKSQLKVVTANDEVNQAYWYRSKKVADSAVRKFYDLAFGSNPDLMTWKVFQDGLSHQDFNQRLAKVYNSQNYPENNFKIKIPLKKNSLIRLVFRDDILKVIQWEESQEVVSSYDVIDDPDVKRVVLRKLRNYYRSESEVSSI